MVRKLLIAGAVMGLSLGAVQAQDDMMGDHPPGPEVILAPPEGFEPPEDMPPPPMTGDPEADKEAMLATFFELMDADGSGDIDAEEFGAWVRDFHMPPPPEGEGPPPPEGDMPPPGGEGPPPGGEGPPPGDDMGEMDGILRAGEGDLADLNIAPECSDEMRDSELTPQAEGVPCGDREGNLLFRTVCNMPGYDSVAISLPDGREAACFGLEALHGEIGFEIVNEDDGSVAFDTTWGKEAYKGLILVGPAVYQIKSTGGSPDGAVTLKFVDTDAGM